MGGPEAAVAGDAEVDGGGEAGEFVVVGGVLGLEGWLEGGVAVGLAGESLEAFFEEVTAFAVEEVGLDEAGPEVGYSYCVW